LQAEEHHPNREARGWQHHVVRVLCCRRDWCTSQNRWYHEEGNYVDILKQHLKTAVRKLNHFATTLEVSLWSLSIWKTHL
jgi:hypothetical protein